MIPITRTTIFIQVMILGMATLIWSCAPQNHVGDIPSQVSVNHRVLSAISIRQGDIPKAMQWKRQTVLTPWVGERDILLHTLRNLPASASNEDNVITLPVGKIPAFGDLHIYLLYGWSTSGRDALRSIAVDSAVIAGDEIRIYVSRPELIYEGSVAGTADMKFIGWDIATAELAGGDYRVLLFEKRDRVKISTQPYSRVVEAKGKYQMKKELDFQVVGVR